ncbi:MAG: DUF2252 family protein, partial [Candidatus Sericytochromatia bacterium]|nr:DUF2252 family protein [Candidatus Sericytochromatia bacterium]
MEFSSKAAEMSARLDVNGDRRVSRTELAPLIKELNPNGDATSTDLEAAAFAKTHTDLTKDDLTELRTLVTKSAAFTGSQIVMELPATRATSGPVSHDPKAAAANIDKDLARTGNPAGTAAKVGELKVSPFKFFRGTSPQFYREMIAGLKDSPLTKAPRTMLQGDIHPENFGVVRTGAPDATGKVPVTFGLTDFDEATPGPASFDLVRGMSSLVAAGWTDPGLMAEFLKAYAEGLGGNTTIEAPEVTTVLTKKGKQTDAKMMAERTTPDGKFNLEANKKNPDDRIDPASNQSSEITTALAKVPWLEGQVVTDILRDQKGTASSDLQAYDAVVGGTIVELKELTPSNLAKQLSDAGLAPTGNTKSDLERYQAASTLYLGDGAPKTAMVAVSGKIFLVKPRAAEKGSVKLESLKTPDQKAAYVRDMGRALGAAHGRSGDPAALKAFVADPAKAGAMIALATT